ncbi:MAG: 50S ribosomal protein L11 methyltransferase [Eubacteriales bacterium]|nr:50S ribosomal protein L11 methyltransferase [Eubacteriales bacterium]
MNWMQVCIETTEDAADLVSSVLIDAGAAGVEIEGGSHPDATGDEWPSDSPASDTVLIKAYYGEQEFEKVFEFIKPQLALMRSSSDIDMGPLYISVGMVADTDWNENFRKHFTAFRAAGNIVIKPTWEQYEYRDGDIVIEMDPGMAFGSGEHETTRMCLELVQKYMREGASVLDVGCGSGILGIACAKLGAGEVLALDNDGTSVRVTRDNALQNGAGHLTVRQSDLLKRADKKAYDLVLANIITDIIMRLNADVAGYMATDGVYIMSGIIEDRLGDVLESLDRHGFTVIETMSMGDWRAVAARRRDA